MPAIIREGDRSSLLKPVKVEKIKQEKEKDVSGTKAATLKP